MGTREGGVHVLKMDFNREEKDSGKDHGEMRAEAVASTPRSDMYSSSSAAPSRLSSPAVVELGLEPMSDRLVRGEREGRAGSVGELRGIHCHVLSPSQFPMLCY